MTFSSNVKGFIKKDAKTGKDAIVLIFKNSGKSIEVRISPYFGSNIYKFKYNGYNIFYCDYDFLKARDWTGCFILFPYPNRVRNKEFEFEGKKYSLKNIKRKRGNYPLIHGLIDDKIWQLDFIKKGKNSVTASTFIDITPGTEIYKYFPFKSRLSLIFTLNEYGLKVDYKVENNSDLNLPFGFALHPYFSRLLGKDNTFVMIPARSVMETDEELLPTGKLIDVVSTNFNLYHPAPISKLSLDHVFTNLKKSQTSYINFYKQRIKLFLETSQDFTHIVVYTMKKDYFCLENQTGSTDMINLHNRALKEADLKLIKAAHLLILPPGKEHKGYINYRVEKY